MCYKKLCEVITLIKTRDITEGVKTKSCLTRLLVFSSHCTIFREVCISSITVQSVSKRLFFSDCELQHNSTQRNGLFGKSDPRK